MFKSQVELENKMRAMAYDRADGIMTRNEMSGLAWNNAYGKIIGKRFIEPLAAGIQMDMEEPPGRGRRRPILGLLAEITPETAAFISVRVVIEFLMSNKLYDAMDYKGNGRDLYSTIGKALQAEMLVRQYKEMDPKMFYFKMKELDDKNSVDIRHKTTVIKRDMKVKGVVPLEWARGSREIVGCYMIERLRLLGFLSVKSFSKGGGKSRRTYYEISFTDEVFNDIKAMRDLTIETMPFAMPLVEKPLPWLTEFGGGYHTVGMQRLYPIAIKGGAHGDPSVMLKAMSILQDTSWAVNDRVLTVAHKMRMDRTVGEIVGPVKLPLPFKPSFLEFVSTDDMTPEQTVEFKSWKRSMAEYHTQKKKMFQKEVSMNNIFTTADMFLEESEFYFAWKADFRARLYPIANGVSPQGSDLAKGLIHFSKKKGLHNQKAVENFLVHGPNKYGYDKATIAEQIKWVKQNHELIILAAEDPLNNEDWLSADKPFQFLAWCFEYKDYVEQGPAFKSQIPVSVDGSCNGLQHFSAMLRDEVGGAAVNLIPSTTVADIYTDVAKRTEEMITAMPEDPAGYRSKWLAHGIKRKLVKRSVMTMPYGSVQFSSKNFIYEDYMTQTIMPEFTKEEMPGAAMWLAKVLWKAIGLVVVKAREAMDWLQEVSRLLTAGGNNTIQWMTPTGLIVNQRYVEYEDDGRIDTELFRNTRLRLSKPSNRPDRNEHKNGMAPNFVHSMDASHLQFTVLRAHAEGIEALAMIHDDYGTHAADAEKLGIILREEFVKMYSGVDYLELIENAAKAAGITVPPRPKQGNLDLSQVIHSVNFFK